MKLNFDAEEVRRFLDACEDAEDLGGGEYTVDLYDAQSPLSLDLTVSGKDGVQVLAALTLLYDEEMDGWYLGDRVEDAEAIAKALRQAMEAAAT